jgi:hypothetical protein
MPTADVPAQESNMTVQNKTVQNKDGQGNG